MNGETIRIVEAKSWNWYKVGEIYTVLDDSRYVDIGVQVVRENNGRVPDVVEHGHYELID